jgi:two-component system, cell cycle sensor histidine kinase and response regulator CckA
MDQLPFPSSDWPRPGAEVGAGRSDGGNLLDARPSATHRRLLTEGTGDPGRALDERVKELRCLYRVSQVLFAARSLDEAMDEVVAAIPPGWQRPEHTHARLTLPTGTHTSPGFREGALRMGEPILLEGEEVGRLEVHCLLEGADGTAGFLTEERELLRALAERVAETLARHRTEERLRRRESHFRALVESAADLIVLLDEQGAIRYASPSAAELTGLAPGTIRGMPVVDVVHPEDHAVLESLRAAALSADGIARAELRIRHRDGGWCTVDAVARNLLHDPEVGRVLVIARDITDRKLLEDQLRHAQKMEAVGRLAGGIAHDFNNLLSVIDLQSEFLGQSFLAGDPRLEELEEIQRASRHGAALTRQLLAFSRRQVTKPRVVSVNRLVRDTERMVRRILGEDIEVVTDLAGDAAAIRIDPSQFEQALLNLVVNARDAMPTGGRLTLRTCLDACHADSPCTPGSQCVRVDVADTGEGMDDDVRDRVFEPFFTTKSGGTGLGLATVYGIVTQNGGHVRIESEKGQGTTFELRFPRMDECGPTASSIPPMRTAPGGNETILVVDDDPGLRRATRRLLGSLGYTVIDAASAAEALDLADTHQGPIHLLLSDVVMPVVGGLELARKLASRHPETRVLFFSGYDGGSVVDGASIDPEVPLLPKPFTHAQIAEAVRGVLDHPSE